MERGILKPPISKIWKNTNSDFFAKYKKVQGCQGLATLLEGAGLFFTKFRVQNLKIFFFGVNGVKVGPIT